MAQLEMGLDGPEKVPNKICELPVDAGRLPRLQKYKALQLQRRFAELSSQIEAAVLEVGLPLQGFQLVWL